MSRAAAWQGESGGEAEAGKASSAGCGRARWNTTSKSLVTFTSLTFLYQPSRGFLRRLSFVLPCKRSIVHFTSLAVNGLPSCHFTPWRSLKVSSVRSSFHDQL